MKNKAIMGSALLGLTIVLLTMSGSVTQAQIVAEQSVLDTSAMNLVFVEEMRIIAGIDSAAVIELDLIGGVMPAIDSNPLFSAVKNWAFIASDQSGYQDYILRRPFKSPDNATLLLDIDDSLGIDGSLIRAVEIALLFNAAYGTNLMWSRAEALPGSYLYFFTGAMPNTIFNTLIAEYQADISDGFASLLDPVEITASPVKVAFMGRIAMSGLISAARGLYYINVDAITEASTYTLSTYNIFGVDVAPTIGLLKFSVLKFRFPYTINPSSITPKPGNFAPQITGKMDWDLNAPWSLAKPAMNYEVIYNIDHSALTSSPRVSVNMAYDQVMLNDFGRLQMDYVVTNTGTEDAVDIDISYPLGPDFLNYLAKKPVLSELRDDVTINETYTNNITGTILMTFEGDLFLGAPDIVYEQEFLVLNGWYQNKTDMSYIDIDPLNTAQEVKYDIYFFDEVLNDGTVTTSVTFSSPDGLPNTLVNLATAFLAPINLFDYAWFDVPNVVLNYQDKLWKAVIDAGDDLFDILYTNQTIFDPDPMDFGFTTREVGRIGTADTYNEVFLNTTIQLLHPGESVNVSWALDNIPSRDDHYGMMGLAEINVDAPYPALQLTTIEKTGYDVMQYLFGLGDAIAPHLGDRFSRPLSYYEPWTNTWLSTGARFAYMDTEGFEYFGFSNGINLQIADDEAVLNVHVSLNDTAYLVGDPVTVYYSIENTGDLPAEEVLLILYHGRMGADWQIVDRELFWIDDIGTIENGTTYYGQADVLANSFLGIHPVYGVAGFKSDVGQTVLSDGVITIAPGLTSIFAGAAETYQLVVSNMDWGLVLPKTQDRRPAFPQPILDIDVSVEFIIPTDAPWELEITITITNIGDERTHITAIQFYNATEMQLLRKITTEGYTTNATHLGVGVILFEGITLFPGEEVTLTIRWLFLTSNGCYIPSIIVVYDSRFASDVGNDVVDTAAETDAPLLFALDGSAQDEDDWEDYGESTQTGSSAGADVFTGGTHTRRIGSYDMVFWSISAIFVTAVATTSIRKKLKN
jgi:hypothetical protein